MGGGEMKVKQDETEKESEVEVHQKGFSKRDVGREMRQSKKQRGETIRFILGEMLIEGKGKGGQGIRN
jgi:hypothetical protein